MFLADCSDPAITLTPCKPFLAMDGTGTYGVQFRDAFVPDELILADPATPFVKKIRAGFILLQAGMALGVIRDCINIMDEVDNPLGHINRYLPQQPVHFRDLAAELETEAMALARDPYNDEETYWRKVDRAPPSRRRGQRRGGACGDAALWRARLSRRATARSAACARPISSRSSRPPPSNCARCSPTPDLHESTRKTTNLNGEAANDGRSDLCQRTCRSLEDRAVCRDRHPQSRRLWRRASPQCRERARDFHLPRDVDTGRHRAS